MISYFPPAPSIMMVSSFEMTTFLHLPNTPISLSSNFNPNSSEITVPPREIAISFN